MLNRWLLSLDLKRGRISIYLIKLYIYQRDQWSTHRCLASVSRQADHCYLSLILVVYVFFQSPALCYAPSSGFPWETAERSLSENGGQSNHWTRAEPHPRHPVLAGWRLLQCVLEVQCKRVGHTLAHAQIVMRIPGFQLQGRKSRPAGQNPGSYQGHCADVFFWGGPKHRTQMCSFSCTLYQVRNNLGFTHQAFICWSLIRCIIL